MPPIDPKQLLNALGPLLTDDGGIKGAEEASRIIRLMTDATKLVNRCIYLNILRVTSSQEALEKFISVGGWDTLNNWLDSARNTSNDPLVGELLEVYLNLPVTVVLLKQNSTAKTIKQLRKAENEKIQKLSAELVERWTKIIRDQNNADNDAEEKRKKKKHKEKERERDKERSEKDKEREKERDKSEKEKDKERDKEKDRKERDKEKDRNSKNHHHHSHSDKDRKDRSRDRHKDKEKSRHNSYNSSSSNKESSSVKTSDSSFISKSSKNTINSTSKIPPNLDTPSSTYSGTDSNSSNAAQTTSDQKKDEELRRRPKTVKQFGGKFRSLGLSDDEGDDDIEPIKKKMPDKAAASKRATIERSEDMAPEKKPRLHISMPSLHSTSGDGASTTPPDVTHGRIKIIPPKRAPAHEIHESNVFMDALQQSSSYSYGGLKRKKKLPSPSVGNPNAPPSLLSTSIASGASPPSATSPPAISQSQDTQATSPPLLSPTSAMAQRLPSVPSFYRDTLEDLPETSESDKGQEEDKEEEDKDKDSSPPVLESMEVDDGAQNKKEETETTEENEWGLGQAVPPKIDEEVINEAPVSVQRPTKKKSVTWVADAHLEEVFYFELDETERENVNRPKSFIQMKKEEAMMDRKAMDAAKRLVNDNMVEVLQWKSPKLIDNVIVVVEPGCNSKEREIQMEREKGVLCALFFNKVPDTPIEPDPDIPSEQEDTKLIPLEDENGSCTEYEHTYNQNDPSSLPYDPEFDMPIQNQGQGGPGMGQGRSNMGGNNFINNGMSGNLNTMGMNLPPALNHLLQTLQQQAQETRDPLMANLQNMLSNVLQTTNPQDGSMLMERVLNTLEQFRNQIPDLHNLINSITNGSMDMGGAGPRPFMNQQGPPGPPGPMGAPRHGLLGPHPPGFNMMGGGGGGVGGGMRPHPPPMQGPGPMMGGGGGGGGGGGNFYMGKQGGPGPGPNMDKMRMGGPPPNQWRGGGGGRRPFNKRGRSQICQHFINKGCKYGDSCSFIHPANGPNS